MGGSYFVLDFAEAFGFFGAAVCGVLCIVVPVGAAVVWQFVRSERRGRGAKEDHYDKSY